MAKYRFKGSERHSVPVLGRYVDPREVVEVSDEVAAANLFPEELWTEMTPPSAKAKKAAAADNADASDAPAKDGE